MHSPKHDIELFNCLKLFQPFVQIMHSYCVNIPLLLLCASTTQSYSFVLIMVPHNFWLLLTVLLLGGREIRQWHNRWRWHSHDLSGYFWVILIIKCCSKICSRNIYNQFKIYAKITFYLRKSPDLSFTIIYCIKHIPCNMKRNEHALP